MTLLAFVASMLLLFAVRGASGSWFHPATLFSAYWAFVLFLVVVFQLDDAPRATWFVVATLCVALGTAALSRHTAGRPGRLHLTSPRWASALLPLATVAGVLATTSEQLANGVTPFGVGGASVLTELRYGGELKSPVLSNLMLAFVFACALAAPFLAARWSGIRRLALTMLPVLGLGYYALGTTARAPFVVGMALTIASLIIVWVMSARGAPHVSTKLIKPVAAVAVGGVGFFLVTTLVRMGHANAATLTAATDKIAVYSVGSVVALDRVIGTPVHMTFGAETFAGVGRVLVKNPELGKAYSEYASIGRGMATNVYTSHWQLIRDFGAGGALLALAVILLIAGLAADRMVRVGSVPAASILSVIVAYILFGQAQSIFIFLNVCLGVAIGVGLIIALVRAQPTESSQTPASDADQ